VTGYPEDSSEREEIHMPVTAQLGAPQGLELRHLRYFVALADEGNFTQAAGLISIAQPTLSQQIRRLEQIIGTPLLERRRDGLQLTKAGAVLLEASRGVLSLVDQGISLTRQVAGVGRQHLRVVLPPGLPDCLTVPATSVLRSAAEAAGVDVTWLERPLDAEFSLIQQRRADAGLGWLTTGPEALPAPLDAMSLGEFAPEVWIPRPHPAARHRIISLPELAGMVVIHGPRRVEPGTYDAWTTVLRAVNPRFEFTDPPFRHSLPIALAFAASSGRPAAVLTGPTVSAGTCPGPIRPQQLPRIDHMVRVGFPDQPLTATATLVWSGDLPRPLQQVLFDTADRVTAGDSEGSAAPVPISA
jgi:DNA-binding transcriptional LysR family regulator